MKSILRALLPALPFAAYLLIAVLLQAFTGAWDAPFTSHPDEPAHFVGAVMVRDYVPEALRTLPLPFARDYYRHYPFFGIGHWPPFFYAVTAAWFLVAGIGRLQALLVVAAATAGAAAVVCSLARRRGGALVGFSAGLLFLSLPEVQRWTCAVMADSMVALFSLATAFFLIRYFERATFFNAIYFGLCAALAGLTKYSGLYVCALPAAALVCLRRFDLLRKPGFLVHPLVIAGLVGPWAIWAAGFATTGYPSGTRATAPRRALYCALTTFHLFPPVLLAVVVCGLLLLALRPRAWRADLAVLGLLWLGLCAFLSTVSRVGTERRYVLAGSAALLVLAFAGWAAALEPRPRVFPALSLILALAMAATHLGGYVRPPCYPIRTVVEAVERNPKWAGKRIVVAPVLEGSVIAEFAIQDRHRPGHELIRPSKAFATCDWFGLSCVPRFNSAAEMMASLRRDPVDVLLWHQGRGRVWPHAAQMAEMVKTNPLSWRKTASFDSSAWQIYEYVPRDAAAVPAPP